MFTLKLQRRASGYRFACSRCLTPLAALPRCPPPASCSQTTSHTASPDIEQHEPPPAWHWLGIRKVARWPRRLPPARLAPTWLAGPPCVSFRRFACIDTSCVPLCQQPRHARAPAHSRPAANTGPGLPESAGGACGTFDSLPGHEMRRCVGSSGLLPTIARLPPPPPPLELAHDGPHCAADCHRCC